MQGGPTEFYSGNWDIITPHVRGIIGIFRASTSGLQPLGQHQNSRGAENANDPEGMGFNNRILTWLGQLMKKTLQARFPV